MCITRYSLGCELLCALCLYECWWWCPSALSGKVLLLWLWGYIGAALCLCYVRLCYGSVIVMLRLLLRLLYQPEKRLCYGRPASQEKKNVSAVPMAPLIFFQPLSLSLAFPGFIKQWKECEQQDNWRREQDQQYSMKEALDCQWGVEQRDQGLWVNL